MTSFAVAILIVTGLVAGLLAGLLGIGGSVIMIPVINVGLGADYHLAQAAAMCVNVLVAIPAFIKHYKKRAIRFDVAGRMLPGALIAIVVGVMLSDRLDGDALEKIFGVFLLYAVYINARKLFQKRSGNGDDEDEGPTHADWLRCTLIGVTVGLAAGLLGIGGGVIAVALIHRFCNLPLRNSVAVSSTVMCLTAPVGAARKLMGLHDLHHPTTNGLPVDAPTALLIAAVLATTAIAASYAGAHLTHKLPVVWVRAVFTLLLVVACVKMLAG
ncbi:sulfite exporter TauE/SafE family protein [Phycisphaeraceae bacterium D3-23]